MAVVIYIIFRRVKAPDSAVFMNNVWEGHTAAGNKNIMKVPEL
jgi:hypothetical protein